MILYILPIYEYTVVGPTLNQAVLGDPQASSSSVHRPRPRMASTVVAVGSAIEPVNIDHSDCDGKENLFYFFRDKISSFQLCHIELELAHDTVKKTGPIKRK